VKPNQEVKRWMSTVCHSSTLNSRILDLNSTEQSENVYENKRGGQEVKGSMAMPNILFRTPGVSDALKNPEGDSCSSRGQRPRNRAGHGSDPEGVE